MSDWKAVPLTREQIEEWREELLRWCDGANHDKANALCDMALQSLDMPAAQAQSEGEPKAVAWYDLDQMTVHAPVKPTIPGTWKPLYAHPPGTLALLRRSLAYIGDMHGGSRLRKRIDAALKEAGE